MESLGDAFYTVPDLCRRWNVSDDTIRRLTARGVLESVSLPGRRVAYRKSSIEQIESQYRGPAKGHRLAIAADDALRLELRSRECWSEFCRQCSPLDPDHALIEKMLAAKLANDPSFGPDDVETFCADKRAEYAAVREHASKQAMESTGSPELRLMVGEGR